MPQQPPIQYRRPTATIDITLPKPKTGKMIDQISLATYQPDMVRVAMALGSKELLERAIELPRTDSK